MYKEVLLDHYKNPRNAGSLDGPDYQASGENEVCGDHVTWYVKTQEGVIEQAVFDGDGCAISQAATSMLSERIQGKTVEEVLAMGREDMLGILDTELTPLRVKCALLGLKTLQKALTGDTDED